MRGYLRSAAITLDVQTRFARRVARLARPARRRRVVSGRETRHSMIRNVHAPYSRDATRSSDRRGAVRERRRDRESAVSSEARQIPDLTWTRILKFVAAISHSLVQVEL